MSYKLTAYPKELMLRDGANVVVRPLSEGDEDALGEFFRKVPGHDRYFLKDDVTSPKVIGRWTSDIDYARALPLVAIEEGRIIANGVLLRSRHGAYASVGSIRIVVEESARQRGLGTALMKELCDIAADADLERVTAEFVGGVQDDAIVAAERLGFLRAATIHELLRGEDGHLHDVVVMSLPLGKWYEWWQF
jgi:L-amino acid N-acyltransferase YncA